MNRHLLLFIAFFFLVLSWFTNFLHFLRTWFAHLRTKPSIAKCRRRNKSLPCLFPAKRPDCPLCQAGKNLPSKVVKEPPPLIKYKRGRPHSIDKDMRFCPNDDCEYYGWLARGNIYSNGHPNSSVWRQLKCIVCGTYFMGTQGTIFYCSKASPGKIILALKIMSERVGIQSTAHILEMNHFRRILIRWEKKVENYLAMLHFACAWISFQAAGLFG